MFFSRSFLSPVQVCLVLPQLSLTHLPKVGSLGQQHQLGTCWKFRFSGLTLELLHYVLICGCRSGAAIGRDTKTLRGMCLLYSQLLEAGSLAHREGHTRKHGQEVGAQQGGGSAALTGASVVFPGVTCGCES